MALSASWNVNGWSETGFAFGMTVPQTKIDTDRRERLAVYWSCGAEGAASVVASASCYHVEKDVRVLAIVETILKFRKVQWQVVFADVVKGADDSALNQAPERFNIVCVNQATHVFALPMPNRLMRKSLPAIQILIAGVLIGRNQFNLFANGFGYETVQRRHIGTFDHLANEVALAGDRADDGYLVTNAANVPFLVPVAIRILTTDVSFIDFDLSEQLRKTLIEHRGADACAHIPSRPIVATANLPMNLERADSLLALSHQVDDLKPDMKRIVRVLENRLGDDREAIAVATAAVFVLTGPMKGLVFQFIYSLAGSAAWAFYAVRPAQVAKQNLARLLIVAELLHHFGQRDRWLRGKRLSSFNFRVHANNITIPRAGVKPNIIAQKSGRGGRIKAAML